MLFLLYNVDLVGIVFNIASPKSVFHHLPASSLLQPSSWISPIWFVHHGQNYHHLYFLCNINHRGSISLKFPTFV